MADWLQQLLAKDDATFVVTDSGLGGLSVLADLEAGLTRQRLFRTARLVFFNAHYAEGYGYNSLPSREDRIRLFDSALQAMESRYRPDLILVACNTLSVIADDTAFAAAGRTPLIGIVDAGVSLLETALRHHPDARAVLFATPTTVNENNHRKILAERGVDPDRILPVSCRNLTDFIETNYQGAETRREIGRFVSDAVKRLQMELPRDAANATALPPVYISLNCTHYGYSTPLWVEAFRARGIEPRGVLNPNRGMLDMLFNPTRSERFETSDVRVSVVSRTELAPPVVASLGTLLARTSPATAQALREWRRIHDLFPWPEGMTMTGGWNTSPAP